MRIEARVKDTRARLIERFTGSTYALPAALFQLSEAELAAEQAARKRRFEFGRWDDGEDVISAEQTREASDDGNKWTENVQTESASATAD